MNYIEHYEASFWMLGLSLLSDRETIEMQDDSYCQNFISGKDITLKTTPSFFTSSYELNLTL